MIAVFRFESFFSVWYWVLTIVVWTIVCQRTLGVPHDMVVRSARLPEVASRVDLLARIGAERVAGLARTLGAAAAALAGFALAGLATLAYVYRIEPAEAAFLIVLPLAIVGVGTVRLARQIHGGRLEGEELRRGLARRRMTNQAIAMIAMLCAALAALGHPPRPFGF